MPARRTAAALATGAIALASFGAALPSGAQANTTVSFTVSGSGGLAVSSAATGTLGSGATINLLSAADLTGTLPSVTVTDNRAALAGNTWTVTVAGSDFVNQSDNDYVIPDENAHVYIDTLGGTVSSVTNLLGAMLVAGGENELGTNTLDTNYTLVNGTTSPLLTGSATVTPSMEVTVPAGAAAGTYTGTITYTAT